MKTIFISVAVATTCGLVVLIADNDSLIFILFHNNSSTIYLISRTGKFFHIFS
jgi:hypothetical protein